MSRITRKLQNLKQAGKSALIVYITGGCPDISTTFEALQAAEAAGADIIEIGIPFSDPMADGPVIQKAASQALTAGVNIDSILSTVKFFRCYSEIPLVLMTYFNPVLQVGCENFIHTSLLAGVDGLIIPDLPLEECQVLSEPCKRDGMDLIQFVAPTTKSVRLAANCKAADGFVYCISNTGVTGARDVDYSLLQPLIGEIRENTDLSVAIGFGIGSAAAAREAASYADAVIVGSAVMQKLMDEGVAAMGSFIGELRQALDQGR